MKAYKCDRCGILFESPKMDPKEIVHEVELNESIRVEQAEYCVAKWAGNHGWNHLDFCPDCQEKFRVFMFGKEDTDDKTKI